MPRTHLNDYQLWCEHEVIDDEQHLADGRLHREEPDWWARYEWERAQARQMTSPKESNHA